MKSTIRSLVRWLVYLRLQMFPLNEGSALVWAERMKRWPAIFALPVFERVKITRYGARMNVGLIDVIERAVYVSGSWDEHVALLMMDSLTEGQTVVDIGANIGYFTLLASKLVGTSGKVLAIEPSHRNLKKLCEHLWLNVATNVAVLSVAAGRGKTRVSISFPTYNNCGAATLRPIKSLQSHQALQVALDDVFEAHSIRPDFIKMDIEGFELEALRGMERTLRCCSPMVVCEISEKFLSELGQSTRELLAFMKDCGYSCEVISTSASIPAGAMISPNGELPAEQFDAVFRRVA